MNIQTEIRRPGELSSVQMSAWAKFCAANPALYSPYFHIGYTQLLGELRGDVHVLCVSRNGSSIAFLPFQAKISDGGKIGFARPIGAPMTDYHGFICAPDTGFDAAQVLKQAGFGAFHFSALVDTGAMLSGFARASTSCTMMDISGGADAWRAARDGSYRRHLKSTRRRIRKSEELGERRFEFMSSSQDVFDTLIKWKRKKFAQTGKYDVLSADWTMDMLQELWRRGEQASLHADMHALYFGDKLAAIDLGLCDGVTFHSWMVAYNSEFHQLAPGIQLLEALIDEGAGLGYTRIDLGEGQDGYKRQYATGDVQVLTGFIAANGPAAALSQIYGVAENFGEKRLGGVGRLPGKARRRYAQISACEDSLGGRAKAMFAAVKGAPK